jgi:hypothetical protein
LGFRAVQPTTNISCGNGECRLARRSSLPKLAFGRANIAIQAVGCIILLNGHRHKGFVL